MGRQGTDRSVQLSRQQNPMSSRGAGLLLQPQTRWVLLLWESQRQVFEEATRPGQLATAATQKETEQQDSGVRRVS